MTTITPTQQHFDATLVTLSPLHIGTGEELEKDIDFVAAGKETLRLNVDRILFDLWNEQVSRTIPNPADMLETLAEAEREDYILYRARGTIRASRTSSKLRECIKTPEAQPYIPGSSLKGALRTALAWSGWDQQVDRPLRREDIGRSKSWAGQTLEAQLFRDGGQDRPRGPNLDLMRALHVGDLHVTDMGKGWQVLNVQVARSRDFASPIEVEAVGRDAQFKGRLSIDTYLFSDRANAQLQLNDRRVWLDELTKRVNLHTQERLRRLLNRFEHMHQDGIKQVREFHAGVSKYIDELPPGQCILCLGWGGGWDSKTFGTRLQSDPNFFERAIVESFRLSRGKGQRQPGSPFPATRRVQVRQRNGEQSMVGTLGWVALQLSPHP